MVKKVTRYISFISIFLLLVSSSLFTVYADLDGTYYYVPTDSVLAYKFFLNYGLTWGKYISLGSTEIREDSYRQYNNRHDITATYSYMYYNDTNHQTTFRNSNGTQVAPNYYESAYYTDIPLHYSYENNAMTSTLAYSSLKGNIINPSAYSTDQRVQLKGNSTIVISWISFQPQIENTTFYSSTSINDFTSTAKVTQVLGSNKAYKYIYTLTSKISTTQWITPRFHFSSSEVEIIPLYIGDTSELPDDMAKQLGLSTETETQLKISNQNLTNILSQLQNANSKLNTLIEGNTQSQNISNTNNSTTSTFNSETNDYHDNVTNSFDSLDNSLDQLDLNNDLYSNNGFLSATNFIRSQFMWFVSNDPSHAIELLIVFALILGVSLTIIGKLRN